MLALPLFVYLLFACFLMYFISCVHFVFKLACALAHAFFVNLVFFFAVCYNEMIRLTCFFFVFFLWHFSKGVMFVVRIRFKTTG